MGDKKFFVAKIPFELPVIGGVKPGEEAQGLHCRDTKGNRS